MSDTQCSETIVCIDESHRRNHRPSPQFMLEFPRISLTSIERATARFNVSVIEFSTSLTFCIGTRNHVKGLKMKHRTTKKEERRGKKKIWSDSLEENLSCDCMGMF